MRKPILFLLAGVLIGVAATSYFKHSGQELRFATVPARDLADEADMSAVEAETHRRDRYASIRTIEDTLALPTDFAETEALYVLAGRADADELQNLIHQAARIRERTDRNAALGILFLRMTELDPRSAIAIARSAAFGADSSFESSVWRSWGRLDLDAAIAAAEEGNDRQRNLAAQALYASLRGLDESGVELIRAALGVNPGRNVRTQRVYALADKSPADAIRYIESLQPRNEQQEQFRQLAFYLSRNGEVDQVDYAQTIQSYLNRRVFEQSIITQRIQSDPEAALNDLLDTIQRNPQSQNQIHYALAQLAESDPDKAMQYIDRLPNASMQSNFKSMVATVMARSDPAKALGWLREDDSADSQFLLVNVLGEIAQRDPQLALAEAQSIANKRMRDQAFTNIAVTAAQNDPVRAADFVELIEDPNMRQAGVSQIAVQWAQFDFDSAVAWVATLDAGDQRNVLEQLGQNLVYADLDRAIELLPQMPPDSGKKLRMQIAGYMVEQKSVEEAQAFIDRFKGTADYPGLQLALVSQLVATDTARALEMARSVDDARIRDQLYASIVGQQAANDPQLALRTLGSISDQNARTTAVSQIAYGWYARDPSAADAWMRGLPEGAQRDMAIMAMTSQRGDPSTGSWELVQSIGDAAIRKQATLTYITMLARSDATEAKRLLDAAELTESERRQYEQMLDRGVYGY